MISPALFTQYQEMDSEQNRSALSSIAFLFDWFDNRTHSKIDVRLCSITEPNRAIGNRLVRLNFGSSLFD